MAWLGMISRALSKKVRNSTTTTVIRRTSDGGNGWFTADVKGDQTGHQDGQRGRAGQILPCYFPVVPAPIPAGLRYPLRPAPRPVRQPSGPAQRSGWLARSIRAPAPGPPGSELRCIRCLEQYRISPDPPPPPPGPPGKTGSPALEPGRGRRPKVSGRIPVLITRSRTTSACCWTSCQRASFMFRMVVTVSWLSATSSRCSQIVLLLFQAWRTNPPVRSGYMPDRRAIVPADAALRAYLAR